MLANLLYLTGFSLLLTSVKSQSQNGCPLQGKSPLKQIGLHNYVVDSFAGVNFPFAINQCTSTDFSNTKWYKYVCNSPASSSEESSITKLEYSTANCTGNGTIVHNWVNNMTGLDLDFECGGMNTFAELQVGLSDNCTSFVTVFAALSSCAVDVNEFNIYCNASTTAIQLYGQNLTSNQSFPTMSTTGSPVMSTTGLSVVSTTGLPSVSTTGLPSVSTTNLGGGGSTTTTVGGGSTTTTIGNSKAAATTSTSSASSTTTTQNTEALCQSSDFCNAIYLSRSKCVSATLFQGAPDMYARMVKCKNLVLIPTSGSVRPHLGITAIITLLLLIVLV
jgi:hypothetical protein